MEPIKKTLAKQLQSPSFKEKYEQARQEVLRHEAVQAFIANHQATLTAQMIEDALPKFLEYTSQASECCHAGSVRACTNAVVGCVPKLVLQGTTVEVMYATCPQKYKEDEARAVAEMISSLHMPRETLSASLSTMAMDTGARLEIARFVANFINQIKETKEMPSKGLYIYGGFGVGKSFILGAVANELANIQVRSVLVYVPEFLREIKQAIDDKTLQQKIDFVKKAPVLMLDDLGAESLTSWSRDEILGAILHYRMAEGLPVFVTSNFDYKSLADHLTYVQNHQEPVKAARIMERIQSTTVPIQLDGTNRRQY